MFSTDADLVVVAGRQRAFSVRMSRTSHTLSVTNSLAAERAGDAEVALAHHRDSRMPARSLSILTQLADLSGEMTPWLWARWAAYQCTRAADPGTDTGEIQRSALDYTVRMFYAERVEDAYLNGGDLAALRAHVLGESWLFRQLCTYELGGLESFLGELASGRLTDAALLARAWAGARMGGYRLGRHGSLVARDLRANRDVALLDLGADTSAPGGWVIGRLVPSGTTPGLLFDTRPVGVDEQTALEVASADTRGGWVSAVKAALVEGRLERDRFESSDLELATDVLSRELVEIGGSAYGILARVAAGTFGPDSMAPYAAAAVLDPHGYAEAMRLLAGTGQPETWSHWAALAPEPARSRLLRLAGLAAAA